MPGIAAALLVSISLGMASATPQQDEARMPLTVTSPYSDFASWVDTRAIAFRDGRATAPGMHPSAEKRVEWLLSLDPVGGCVHAPRDEVNRVGAQPRATLDQAISSADFVLLGRVTGRSYGFYGMHAGQLLRIAVDRVFKGQWEGPVYYAFMPTGTFTLAGKTICAENTEYAAPPEIGAEVFVFTYPPDGQMLSIADPGDIVPVSRSGELDLPSKYRSERAPSSARERVTATRRQLIDRIESDLKSTGR